MFPFLSGGVEGHRSQNGDRQTVTDFLPSPTPLSLLSHLTGGVKIWDLELHAGFEPGSTGSVPLDSYFSELRFPPL